MKKKLWLCVAVLAIMVTGPSLVLGAVGCTLNDPDRDIRRIFPEATGYKTQFITIQERGGKTLQQEVEEKLGDKLDTIYETPDVPYAYYTVLQGKKTIGYVHGVNQKGMYGGMQLILATDPKGKILNFYYQKISSPEAKKFRNDDFTGGFKGLTLHDWQEGKTDAIQDPSEKSHEDFLATLRGLKKNLILLDFFEVSQKPVSGGKQ